MAKQLFKKSKLLMVRLLFTRDRAGFLKKSNIFHSFGDNVMIGADSIVMPGVKIGNNVIIAAGSVVTKEITDGVVAGGGLLR